MPQWALQLVYSMTSSVFRPSIQGKTTQKKKKKKEKSNMENLGETSGRATEKSFISGGRIDVQYSFVQNRPWKSQNIVYNDSLQWQWLVYIERI